MTHSNEESVDNHVRPRPMSRRSLLQKGGGLALLSILPGLVAACGGGGSGSSTGGGSLGEVGGSVNFLGSEGMDFPQVLAGFYKKNAIKVQPTFIGSMNEISAKFSAGGSGGVQITNFPTAGVQRLQESGVDLMPLDLSQIPNWRYAEDFIQQTGEDLYVNADGEIVAAPIVWSALALNYDASLIPEPQTWGELREPKFKGKITTVDDPSSNFDLTAEILGFKANEMTKDQLAEAEDFLRAIIANCKTISPSYGDITNLFAQREIEAAFAGYNALPVFAAEAGNKDVKSNLSPEEGGGVFVEVFSIAEGSSNVATQYAIINQLLIPKVNAEAAASVLAAPISKGAEKYLPEEIVDLYIPESQYASFFNENGAALDPPAVSSEFVTTGEVAESWTRLKSEA